MASNVWTAVATALVMAGACSASCLRYKHRGLEDCALAVEEDTTTEEDIVCDHSQSNIHAQPCVEIVHYGSACDCGKTLPFTVEVAKPPPPVHTYDYGYRVEKPPELVPEELKLYEYDLLVPKVKPEEKTYSYDYKVETPPELVPEKLKLYEYDLLVPKVKPEAKTYTYEYEVSVPEKHEYPIKLGTYGYQVEVPSKKQQKKLCGLTATVDRILIPRKDCVQHEYDDDGYHHHHHHHHHHKPSCLDTSHPRYIPPYSESVDEAWASVHGSTDVHKTMRHLLKDTGRYYSSGVSPLYDTYRQTWRTKIVDDRPKKLDGRSEQVVVENSVMISREGQDLGDTYKDEYNAKITDERYTPERESDRITEQVMIGDSVRSTYQGYTPGRESDGISQQVMVGDSVRITDEGYTSGIESDRISKQLMFGDSVRITEPGYTPGRDSERLSQEIMVGDSVRITNEGYTSGRDSDRISQQLMFGDSVRITGEGYKPGRESDGISQQVMTIDSVRIRDGYMEELKSDSLSQQVMVGDSVKITEEEYTQERESDGISQHVVVGDSVRITEEGYTQERESDGISQHVVVGDSVRITEEGYTPGRESDGISQHVVVGDSVRITDEGYTADRESDRISQQVMLSDSVRITDEGYTPGRNSDRISKQLKFGDSVRITGEGYTPERRQSDGLSQQGDSVRIIDEGYIQERESDGISKQVLIGDSVRITDEGYTPGRESDGISQHVVVGDSVRITDEGYTPGRESDGISQHVVVGDSVRITDEGYTPGRESDGISQHVVVGDSVRITDEGYTAERESDRISQQVMLSDSVRITDEGYTPGRNSDRISKQLKFGDSVRITGEGYTPERRQSDGLSQQGDSVRITDEEYTQERESDGISKQILVGDSVRITHEGYTPGRESDGISQQVLVGDSVRITNEGYMEGLKSDRISQQVLVGDSIRITDEEYTLERESDGISKQILVGDSIIIKEGEYIKDGISKQVMVDDSVRITDKEYTDEWESDGISQEVMVDDSVRIPNEGRQSDRIFKRLMVEDTFTITDEGDAFPKETKIAVKDDVIEKQTGGAAGEDTLTKDIKIKLLGENKMYQKKEMVVTHPIRYETEAGSSSRATNPEKGHSTIVLNTGGDVDTSVNKAPHREATLHYLQDPLPELDEGSEITYLKTHNTSADGRKREYYHVEQADVARINETGTVSTSSEYMRGHSGEVIIHRPKDVPEVNEGESELHMYGGTVVEDVIERYPVPSATEKGYVQGDVDEVTHAYTSESRRDHSVAQIENNENVVNTEPSTHLNQYKVSSTCDQPSGFQNIDTADIQLSGHWETLRREGPLSIPVHDAGSDRLNHVQEETVGETRPEGDVTNLAKEMFNTSKFKFDPEIPIEYHHSEIGKIPEYHNPTQYLPNPPVTHPPMEESVYETYYPEFGKHWKPYRHSTQQDYLPIRKEINLNHPDHTKSEMHHLDNDFKTRYLHVYDTEGGNGDFIQWEDNTGTFPQEEYKEINEENRDDVISGTASYVQSLADSERRKYSDNIVEGKSEKAIGDLNGCSEVEESLNYPAHSDYHQTLDKQHGTTDYFQHLYSTGNEINHLPKYKHEPYFISVEEIDKGDEREITEIKMDGESDHKSRPEYQNCEALNPTLTAIDVDWEGTVSLEETGDILLDKMAQHIIIAVGENESPRDEKNIDGPIVEFETDDGQEEEEYHPTLIKPQEPTGHFKHLHSTVIYYEPKYSSHKYPSQISKELSNEDRHQLEKEDIFQYKYVDEPTSMNIYEESRSRYPTHDYSKLNEDSMSEFGHNERWETTPMGETAAKSYDGMVPSELDLYKSRVIDWYQYPHERGNIDTKSNQIHKFDYETQDSHVDSNYTPDDPDYSKEHLIHFNNVPNHRPTFQHFSQKYPEDHKHEHTFVTLHQLGHENEQELEEDKIHEYEYAGESTPANRDDQESVCGHHFYDHPHVKYEEESLYDYENMEEAETSMVSEYSHKENVMEGKSKDIIVDHTDKITGGLTDCSEVKEKFNCLVNPTREDTDDLKNVKSDVVIIYEPKFQYLSHKYPSEHEHKFVATERLTDKQELEKDEFNQYKYIQPTPLNRYSEDDYTNVKYKESKSECGHQQGWKTTGFGNLPLEETSATSYHEMVPAEEDGYKLTIDMYQYPHKGGTMEGKSQTIVKYVADGSIGGQVERSEIKESLHFHIPTPDEPEDFKEHLTHFHHHPKLQYQSWKYFPENKNEPNLRELEKQEIAKNQMDAMSTQHVQEIKSGYQLHNREILDQNVHTSDVKYERVQSEFEKQEGGDEFVPLGETSDPSSHYSEMIQAVEDPQEYDGNPHWGNNAHEESTNIAEDKVDEVVGGEIYSSETKEKFNFRVNSDYQTLHKPKEATDYLKHFQSTKNVINYHPTLQYLKHKYTSEELGNEDKQNLARNEMNQYEYKSTPEKEYDEENMSEHQTYDYPNVKYEESEFEPNEGETNATSYDTMVPEEGDRYKSRVIDGYQYPHEGGTIDGKSHIVKYEADETIGGQVECPDVDFGYSSTPDDPHPSNEYRKHLLNDYPKVQYFSQKYPVEHKHERTSSHQLGKEDKQELVKDETHQYKFIGESTPVNKYDQDRYYPIVKYEAMTEFKGAHNEGWEETLLENTELRGTEEISFGKIAPVEDQHESMVLAGDRHPRVRNHVGDKSLNTCGDHHSKPRRHRHGYAGRITDLDFLKSSSSHTRCCNSEFSSKTFKESFSTYSVPIYAG